MERIKEINEYVTRMYSLPIKNGVKGRCYAKYGRPHVEFDDAYQLVVVKLYEYLLNNPELKFNSDAHLASYVFSCVTNNIVNVVKTKQYKQTVLYENFNVNGNDASVDSWLEALSETDPNISEFEDADEIENGQDTVRLRLNTAFTQMRSIEIQAIKLAANELTYEEAGAEMNMTANNYRSLLYNARKKAKKLLSDS